MKFNSNIVILPIARLKQFCSFCHRLYLLFYVVRHWIFCLFVRYKFSSALFYTMDSSISSPASPTAFALYQELNRKLDLILTDYVPKDYCNEHRTRCLNEGGKDHREIFKRLKECERACSVFDAVSGDIPSEADILRAKAEAEGNATAAARAEDMAIASRIDSVDLRLSGIEEKLKILDASYWSACHIRTFIKNNKIVSAVLGAVALSVFDGYVTLVLVALGRLHDFVWT